MEAASLHSQHSMSWPGNETAVSRGILASAVSDDFLSLLSKYCGLSLEKPASLQLVFSSVLPAAIALCIFQVPSLSSRLRRLPFAVLSLLLLVASICSMPASQVGDTSFAATFIPLQLTDNATGYQTVLQSAISNQQLPDMSQTHKSYALDEHHRPHAAESAQEVQTVNDQATPEGAGAETDVQLTGSMTVAVVPLLLALFLVQAPAAAARARQRQSQAGIIAALAVGLMMLSLATVEAVPSVCPAVKPVCSAKAAVAAATSPAAPKSSAPTAAPVKAESGTKSPPGKAPSPSPAFTPYDTLLAAMGARKEALHVASTPDSASDVPQRVMPITETPRMSKALEQQLFTKLLEVLMAPTNSTATSPATGTVGGKPGPTRPSSPAVAPPVTRRGDDGLVYLENTRLRVGIDMARGGAISHLSSPILPGMWANLNLINTWDSGRLIQQSYYGCPDGSCWSDRPWRWNPVQGGSWHNYPPKMLSSSTFGGVVSTTSNPRNWGSQELLDDVFMTTQTWMLPNMIKLRMSMRYTGPRSHPLRHQELPAVFVDRRLNMLATYTGSSPWTNDQVTFIMPGQTNEYYKPTEGWAAYVDSSTGFGVGVYTPVSDLLVAYRVGGENSTAKSDCSYFAPLVTAAIESNSEFSYDTYIAVGRVDEMRQWFAGVKARLPSTLQLQRSITTTVPSDKEEDAGRPAESLRTATPAVASAAKSVAAPPAVAKSSKSVAPTFKKVMPGPRTLVMSPVQPLARKFYVRYVKPQPELLPSIRLTASKSVPKLTMG